MKNLYAEFAQREAVKPYMPPKVTKSKQVDKEYFFNIVNTLYEEELQSMLVHANAQRNSVHEADQQLESIRLTNDMMEAMQKYPWVVSSRRPIH